MHALFTVADLEFNGIKLGNACVEIDYSIEELTVLADTYKALAPALVAAFTGANVTTTEYMGEDGESLEELIKRVRASE